MDKRLIDRFSPSSIDTIKIGGLNHPLYSPSFVVIKEIVKTRDVKHVLFGDSVEKTVIPEGSQLILSEFDDIRGINILNIKLEISDVLELIDSGYIKFVANIHFCDTKNYLHANNTLKSMIHHAKESIIISAIQLKRAVKQRKKLKKIVKLYNSQNKAD